MKDAARRAIALVGGMLFVSAMVAAADRPELKLAGRPLPASEPSSSSPSS